MFNTVNKVIWEHAIRPGPVGEVLWFPFLIEMRFGKTITFMSGLESCRLGVMKRGLAILLFLVSYLIPMHAASVIKKASGAYKAC